MSEELYIAKGVFSFKTPIQCNTQKSTYLLPYYGIVNRTKLLKGTCLFNLKDDPSESQNLIKKHPEVAQRLQKLYAVWLKEVGGPVTHMKKK